MIREIALLQVQHGWTWDVRWIPRERNVAADALSNNDMVTFAAHAASQRTEIAVADTSLQVAKGVPLQMRGGAGQVDHRPRREVLQPVPASPVRDVWGMLQGQVEHVRAQLPQPAFTTGVNQYLKLLSRARVSLEQGLPQDANAMAENRASI